MKRQLTRSLKEVERLLLECGWDEKADWFRAKREKLQGLDEDSSLFRKEVRSIQKILAGMGSFSDLPMNPVSGSKLSVLEARQKQWDLTSELDEAIAKILKGRRPES